VPYRQVYSVGTVTYATPTYVENADGTRTYTLSRSYSVTVLDANGLRREPFTYTQTHQVKGEFTGSNSTPWTATIPPASTLWGYATTTINPTNNSTKIAWTPVSTPPLAPTATASTTASTIATNATNNADLLAYAAANNTTHEYRDYTYTRNWRVTGTDYRGHTKIFDHYVQTGTIRVSKSNHSDYSTWVNGDFPDDVAATWGNATGNKGVRSTWAWIGGKPAEHDGDTYKTDATVIAGLGTHDDSANYYLIANPTTAVNGDAKFYNRFEVARKAAQEFVETTFSDPTTTAKIAVVAFIGNAVNVPAGFYGADQKDYLKTAIGNINGSESGIGADTSYPNAFNKAIQLLSDRTNKSYIVFISDGEDPNPTTQTDALKNGTEITIDGTKYTPPVTEIYSVLIAPNNATNSPIYMQAIASDLSHYMYADF
jgi:hypothetical protein